MLKLDEVKLVEITRQEYENIAGSWDVKPYDIPGHSYAKIINPVVMHDYEELLHSVHANNSANMIEVESGGKKHKYKPKEMKGKYLGRALHECENSEKDISVHFNDDEKKTSMRLFFRHYMGELVGYMIHLKGNESSLIQIPEMDCSGIEAILNPLS